MININNKSDFFAYGDDFLKSLEENRFVHRVLGKPDIKYIRKKIIEKLSYPQLDCNIWISGESAIVCCAKESEINKKTYYSELFWVNNSKVSNIDATKVFLQARRYAKFRGYDGFLYSKLKKDYQTNHDSSFDHSIYGEIFEA